MQKNEGIFLSEMVLKSSAERTPQFSIHHFAFQIIS